MPWTVSNPPAVAKNWSETEKRACVEAGNAVLSEGGSDEDAIFACIHAAGRGKKGSEVMEMSEVLKDIKELSYEALQSAISHMLNPPTDMVTPFAGPKVYRWIREMYRDRVIVEVDSGGEAGLKLFEIPYTVNSKGEIDFGDPVEVQVTYTPVASKETDASASAEKAKTPMKTEDGVAYPATDFACVPDPEKPSTWKLRLAEGKPGNITRAQLGRAAAAMGPGFRGQKVELTDEERAAAKRRILAEYRKLDVPDEEIPKAVKDVDNAEKEGRRLMGRMKEEVKAAIETLLKFIKWADYEDTGQAPVEGKEGKTVDMHDHAHGFKVYQDKAGQWRWLAWTTNAFVDRDGEIFQTKALEEEVARTDEEWPEGDRRLLFWHIPGSDFGTCDWRGVVGRILVESGTFDGTPRGQKALGYLQAHPDEDMRVSHGYVYRSEDRKDGVYEWLQIKERSMLPGAVAANPWTQFSAKEVTMPLTKEKRTKLEELFGPEEAAAIEKAAEQRTKELEQQGIAFKEGQAKTDASAGQPDAEAVKTMAEGIAQALGLSDLAAGQKAVTEALAGLQQEVAAVKAQVAKVEALEQRVATVETAAVAAAKAEAQKAVLVDLPRRSFYQASRATDTAVDPESEEGKKLLAAAAANAGPPEQNPNHPLNRPLK